MFTKTFSAAAVALAASQLVSAQTFTACNPLEKKCPDNAALGKTETIDFTKGPNDDFFELAAGTTIGKYDGSLGAEFAIKGDKDAPTITAKKYIFFGSVSVITRASSGTGVVSSIVLQSDDLDEIDWEWLGGDKAQVQTNYFGKGDTTTYDRGAYHAVANPQDQFYNYTIDWTPDYVKWIIDGNTVRTLNYNDAKGGSTFPQTPCQLKLGTWVAGGKDSPKGTVEWAGGYTDFSQAPFYAYYKSITVSDYHQGASKYVWPEVASGSKGDGSWKGIKVVMGGSSDDTSSSATTKATAGTVTATGSVAATASVNSTATNSTMMTTVTSARGLTQATDGSDIVSSSANSTIRATMTPAPSSSAPASSTSAPARNGAGKQGAEWANAALVGAGFLAFFAL